MISLPKKPLHQLYEDGDLSKDNQKLYKYIKNTSIFNVTGYISETFKDPSFRPCYDDLLYYESSVIKRKDKLSTKLQLIPITKKGKIYIFAETFVVDESKDISFKETHYILFPIQYLEFTNQEFDTNYLVHEYKVRHLLLESDIKPNYSNHFEPDKQVINQLTESFKDVFL